MVSKKTFTGQVSKMGHKHMINVPAKQKQNFKPGDKVKVKKEGEEK